MDFEHMFATTETACLFDDDVFPLKTAMTLGLWGPKAVTVTPPAAPGETKNPGASRGGLRGCLLETGPDTTEVAEG